MPTVARQTGNGARPVRVAELPYRPDSAPLFEAVAAQPWAAFLDSGPPHGRTGRYDILVAEPWATLTTDGGVTTIADREALHHSREDPFELLRHWLRPGPGDQEGPRLPFVGGAVGYFGYDLARRLERLPQRAADREAMPELAVGLYDWAVVVDHRARRSWLVDGGRDPATVERWPALQARFGGAAAATGDSAAFRVHGRLVSNLDEAGYRAAFERVQRYIRDGDCYQVNLARRFAVAAEGEPWTAYRSLRAANPSPFSAFLHTPAGHVLCNSPERFLRVREGAVETRPIKGTRPRDPEPGRDQALAEALRTSAKDRAENVMIVDLLRNDLGKSCVPGSVRVPELFRVESFPNVHHLVSTVAGRLAPDRDAVDLLRGCFPGGSITGAPKVRAMEIIEELEPHRRGVYCGAIGYLGYDGAMDSNIAIRTLVHNRGELRFWAGGGIVRDSECEAEFQETLDKATAMRRLIEEAAGEPSG